VATTTANALPGGEEAQKIFKTKCIVCHGEKGEGNGTGAAALTVKPRNYTDGRWQKSVTDQQIEEIILKGGGAVGKDPGMPANPDLKAKPEVIQDLRKIVRSFAKPEPADAGAGPAASASAGAPAKKPKAPKPKTP
jgi:mono/diheme cytochrome c family protein